jgi:hypothetical protein
MENTYRPSYNEHPKCEKCGREWQLLDWGCALHRLTCGDVPVPEAEQARIIASAKSHGVEIYWR